MKRNSTAYIFLCLSILLSVLGQLMLKVAMNHVSQLWVVHSTFSWLTVLGNFHFLLGLSTLVLGTLFWVLSLSKIDLSFAYPISSVQYVLGFIGAWYFLTESINLTRIIGLAIICLGVGFMGFDGIKYGFNNQRSN